MGVYLPVATWTAALIAVATGRRPTRAFDTGDGRPWIMLLLGVLSALFYSHGLVVVEHVHMTLSIVPALMLAASLLPHTKLSLRGRFSFPGIVVVLLWFVFIIVPTLPTIVTEGRGVAHNIKWALRSSPRNAANDFAAIRSGSCRPSAGFERMACFEIAYRPEDAIRYVEANTSPDDPIFVGLERHDRLQGNNILFYFQSARRPATKWYQFDPGLQTSEVIQAEMVRELQTVKPRYVVLFPADNSSQPNESATSSGDALLDEFIRANYQKVRVFETVSVLHI